MADLSLEALSTRLVIFLNGTLIHMGINSKISNGQCYAGGHSK